MALVRPTFVFVILLSLLFGGLYPFATTKLVQVMFPAEAQGSLMAGKDGQPIGSTLIGQNFSDPKYFWGRVSATTPYATNASNSSGSNFGVNNPALLDAVKARVAALRAADPANTAPVPVDLATASGSGLDPHISIEAARYQLGRVARARGISEAALQSIVKKYTENRQFGILGEPRVNVLELNLALDGKL
jgi:K+-transporting ATPase ATPase C chain